MRLAVGRCSLLRKLCKALFYCKTLKKVTELRVVKFLVPFFFFKKVLFLANIRR